MWQAMADISAREGITIFDFCTRAHEANQGSNLTAAIRAAIVRYLLAALADAECRLAIYDENPSTPNERESGGQDPV
jgi:predicted DNA-binding ribbon-helix-helix protein